MSGTVDGRPVVVGIDGSDSALRAAVWAAMQADRGKVGLRLVRVLGFSGYTYPGAFVPPVDFISAIERDGREQLSAAREAVHGAYPDLATEVKLHTGHPVGALIAESGKAGLVVLGAQGPAGGRRFFAGSTAVAVAGHARCPVAVIPSGSRPPADGPVVVGVDGSPVSEAAVAVAFAEASARDAELVAVHAWTEFASDTEYAYASQFIADWAAIENEQSEMLSERLAGWQGKYPDVVIRRLVSAEKPALALLAHAEGAALLVVGSHGRGGFTGMLLGSVSRTLIHRATCPLVVVRPLTS